MLNFFEYCRSHTRKCAAGLFIGATLSGCMGTSLPVAPDRVSRVSVENWNSYCSTVWCSVSSLGTTRTQVGPYSMLPTMGFTLATRTPNAQNISHGDLRVSLTLFEFPNDTIVDIHNSYLIVPSGAVHFGDHARYNGARGLKTYKLQADYDYDRPVSQEILTHLASQDQIQVHLVLKGPQGTAERTIAISSSGAGPAMRTTFPGLFAE